MRGLPQAFFLQMLLVSFAAATVGCIQGTPGGSGSEESVVAQYVSTKAPEPEHRLDVLFDNKVELLGYDIDPATPEPGKSVRVTWYWHVLEELGDGWSIFTHLVDAETGRMSAGGNFDEASVDSLRRLHPPSRWKAGTYVRDVQRLTLPEKIPFVEAELRIGLFRETRRMTISEGPRDRQKRARGPRFATGYEPPPVAKLIIPRATGPVTIDGELSNAEWAATARTSDFVRATDGRPDRPRTKARLMYDDENLYIAFECDDDHLFSTFENRDDHLWKQDAVEVFIDPRGRGRDYLEFQVSPAGKLFDTKVHRHPRRDDSFDGRAKAAVQREGSLNDDSDRDRGWTAELMVPFAGLGQRPPRPGQEWRLNLFRLETKRNGRRGFQGWSPPLANTTHITGRFGRITFGPTSPGSRTAGSDAGADGGDAGSDGHAPEAG